MPHELYPTLHFGEETWSPEQLRERASEVARGMADAGVASGDIVAVMLRNEPAYIVLLLACRLAGAYLCAINWHFKDAEAGHVLSDSGARIVFVHEDLVAQARGALNAASALRVVVPTPLKITQDHGLVASAADLPADWLPYESFGVACDAPLPAEPVWRGMMPYTSGTTGLPKGIKRLPVPQEQRSAIAEKTLQLNRSVFGIEGDSSCLMSAPLYHSAPYSYTAFAAFQGARIFLESRFDAQRTLELVERNQISHLYLVPTMYRRLLQLPPSIRGASDLTSVRFVASTGSPCPPQTKLAMIEWWGPVIHESYASSETGYLTFIRATEWMQKRGSVGRVTAGARLRVVNEAGADCRPDEVGLIYGRQGAYPDFTYLNNEAARQASALDDLVTVGDMGLLDEDGYLYLSDRKSDMVISGGVNIYPAEIEQQLTQMPGIADSAVFGIPDDDFGEALAAAVQLLPESTVSADDVRQFLKDRMAGYKVPRVVTFHEQLPREDSGKIFKRILRAPYWSGTNRKI